MFSVDHDVPADVARVLRSAGYHADLLKERLPTTAGDSEAFEFAVAEGMVVVTCNRDDFLELAKKRAGDFPGLIVLIPRRSRLQECANLLKLIERAGESGIAGNVLFA